MVQYSCQQLSYPHSRWLPLLVVVRRAASTVPACVAWWTADLWGRAAPCSLCIAQQQCCRGVVASKAGGQRHLARGPSCSLLLVALLCCEQRSCSFFNGASLLQPAIPLSALCYGCSPAEQANKDQQGHGRTYHSARQLTESQPRLRGGTTNPRTLQRHALSSSETRTSAQRMHRETSLAAEQGACDADSPAVELMLLQSH